MKKTVVKENISSPKIEVKYNLKVPISIIEALKATNSKIEAKLNLQSTTPKVSLEIDDDENHSFEGVQRVSC